LANFDDRVQCIKDEYAAFYFEEADKNLNGPLTAGENTADNGGVWEAMYGYEIWRNKEINADKFIPGNDRKILENIHKRNRIIEKINF
jgi:predicted metalloendopeptidase